MPDTPLKHLKPELLDIRRAFQGYKLMHLTYNRVLHSMAQGRNKDTPSW